MIQRPKYKITGTTLRWVTTCERRVWLDENGDIALRDKTTIDVHIAQAGKRHEQKVLAATRPGETIPIHATSWLDAVRLTTDAMQRGVAWIEQACLEAIYEYDNQSVLLCGRLDALRRIDHSSALGAWTYIPIEIKQRRQPNERDFLQLDLYIWLLTRLQRVKPYGELWTGWGFPGKPERHIHQADDAQLDATCRQIIAVITQETEPPIYFADHCHHCEWFSACKNEAHSRNDIALLPKLEKETVRQMREQQITTLDDVIKTTSANLRRIRGLGEVKAARLPHAARAFKENRPIWFGELPDDCCIPGVSFDIETDGISHNPWSLGWQSVPNTLKIAVVRESAPSSEMILPDGTHLFIVSTSDAAWELFVEDVKCRAGYAYHWGAYDATSFKKTAPAFLQAELTGRLKNLLPVFERILALPSRSSGLKEVAQFLGFTWPEGTSNRDAWQLAYLDYQLWQQTDDINALIRACVYQRADVEALAFVWSRLAAQTKGIL